MNERSQAYFRGVSDFWGHIQKHYKDENGEIRMTAEQQQEFINLIAQHKNTQEEYDSEIRRNRPPV